MRDGLSPPCVTQKMVARDPGGVSERGTTRSLSNTESGCNFVYARLSTELPENRHPRSRIPRSKKGVGLCLISLLFPSYGLFCRKERPH